MFSKLNRDELMHFLWLTLKPYHLPKPIVNREFVLILRLVVVFGSLLLSSTLLMIVVVVWDLAWIFKVRFLDVRMYPSRFSVVLFFFWFSLSTCVFVFIFCWGGLFFFALSIFNLSILRWYSPFYEYTILPLKNGRSKIFWVFLIKKACFIIFIRLCYYFIHLNV